jgi:hypothetical protein
LKVPENTVASIILKWKMFGTSTLSTSVRLAKQQSGEKDLGQGRDQEPDGHTDRATEFLYGDGRTFQNDNISAALHQSGLYGKVSRRKRLISKMHLTAHLEFAKRHLKRKTRFSGLIKPKCYSLV